MTQYDFDKLLEKYLNGHSTPEEDIFLDEWASKQKVSESEPLFKEKDKLLKRKIWRRITMNTFNKSRSIFSLKNFGIAASLLFLITLGFWISKSNQSTDIENHAGIEMTNTTAYPQILTLKDGSTVNLQPNSSITFPGKFGDGNRIVYLKGEGFFNVKRDAENPFYVYAGNLVTKVLGTSFTVKSYEKEKISEVIVVSGKVIVYNTESTNGVKKITNQTILTPNKKVVFEKRTQQIKTEVVEKPIALNPPKTHESFLFSEEPLFKVLKKLEIVYGLEIVPALNLKDCVFTGDLNDLELQEQLEFICKSIEGQFEKSQTRFLITGQSCQ